MSSNKVSIKTSSRLAKGKSFNGHKKNKNNNTDNTKNVISAARKKRIRRRNLESTTTNEDETDPINDEAEDVSDEDDDEKVPALGEADLRKLEKIQLQMKQAEKREEYFVSVLDLDPNDSNHRLTMMGLRGVCVTTFCQYMSHYNNLLSYLRSKGLPQLINWDSFADYMTDPNVQRKMSAYEQMEQAVSLWMRCHGHEGKRAQIKAAMKGKRLMLATVPVGRRGAIRYDMLEDMMKLKGIPQEYKDWFFILGIMGMRVNQLISLEFNNCSDPFDNNLKIFIMRTDANHKGCRGAAGGLKRDPLQTYVCPAKYTRRISQAMRRLLARKNPNDPRPMVASDFKRAEGLRYVKLAAAELGWEKDLLWVVHSHRHGAAVEAFLEGNPNDSAVQRLANVSARTGHMTVEMLWHYSETNEERLLVARAYKIAAENHITGLTLPRLVTVDGRQVRTGGRRMKLVKKDQNRSQIRAAFKHHVDGMRNKEQARAKAARVAIMKKKRAGKK
jgi:hypothetical protein